MLATIKHIMKIVFELIKTFAFDILSDNGNIKGKIELFRDIGSPKQFRFSTYEAEMFHLNPTFPRNDIGQPLHLADEMLWIERTFPIGNYEGETFMAENVDEAIKIALSQIESFYQHISQ